MANKNLNLARKVKNDEFYTKYRDIEQEIESYLEFNPNVFRDKSVLLPCDDPEASSFTKFFAASFERLGLRKLVSTSYSEDGNGKKFIIETDKTGDGRINIQDIEWEYLKGDGDFRSPEVCALRDEADFIVTNPPFSIFREFMGWVFSSITGVNPLGAHDTKFLVLGNMNAITYKETFPRIKMGEMWLGTNNGAKAYSTPTGIDQKLGNTCWFTNMEHGRRHQPLGLMTMADNIRYSRHKDIRGNDYKTYDNYAAIEVPFTDAIPSDHTGVMGVPISFLDKFCPDQFEIVDFIIDPKLSKVDGKSKYARILIKHRKPNEN